MTIKTIIFDWDGTMAKTLHLWLEGWQRELQGHDMEMPDRKVVQDFFSEHHKAQIKYPHIDMEKSAISVRDHVESGLHDLALYTHADNVVSDVLERDIQAALVTSSSRDLVEKGLHRHGLAPQFRSILAGDDGFGHKPSALPFNETMKRLDATSETTLVIGDSAADILAARAANCQSCLFMPDENAVFQDRDYLASLAPDHIIQCLSQINDLL
ncbi:MAG: HAD-IA family hydrolase [Amylibacter sp.]|nr:HAD-IA family hydrolase [Amylibacter sp.]